MALKKNKKNDREIVVINNDVPKKDTLRKGPFTTVNTYRQLWIRDNKYEVPMSTSTLESFLLNVLEAKIDSKGHVVFNGKRYSCDEQLLHKFLVKFVGCAAPIVSEPIEKLYDDNGVPVCLK